MVWSGRQEVRGLVDGKHGGFVELGDAIVPPKAVWTFTGEKGSPDVTVRMEIRDGRPECVEVHVIAKPDGRGIMTADLRMFNIDDRVVDTFAQLGVLGVNDDGERRKVFRDVNEARRSTRGTVTPAELADVARVYRENIDRTPTQMVGHLLGYSPRTAARRVEQARAAGLLPKTTPGKRKA